MLALVLISLLVIGITTLYFFSKQNSEYHLERIQRKERTVNSSLQYFFNDLTPKEVSDFITKDFDYKVHEIADVNSLAIVIYNLKGEVLINTSDSTYVKKEIDPYLLFKLKKDSQGRFVENSENGEINSYSYAKNKHDENMVIINIPYNPSNYNPKSEVWSFLNNLLEVFLLLLIGAGALAFFLSRYITRSIAEVRKKIESVQINERNEKLIWDRKDEIGVLVGAYNEMIDKLEISKEKLAKNERQVAWREMAKQVAHEIKNPLTPMKLSVQHLRRSLEIKDKKQLKKMNEFEAKMIQQINLLSEIAGEFSSFAELPKAKMKTIDLINIVKKTVSLFQNNEDIIISVEYNEKEDFLIVGDSNQFSRVFTNLINNSIQAIEEKGNIEIIIKNKEPLILIDVIDNGKGIPDEIKQHIFEPQFTTKSNGKGLGLAMVHQIILNHNGKISLIGAKEKGACFKISVPKKEE
tara:strand:- start:8815 stop:10212 length:1398 start_codon:yes stop_codon:yes gene_type:complete